MELADRVGAPSLPSGGVGVVGRVFSAPGPAEDALQAAETVLF